MNQSFAPKRRRGVLSRVLGDILITIGILALLYAFYEAVWTNLDSRQRQSQVDDALVQSWSEQPAPTLGDGIEAAAPPPVAGEAFSRLHVPSFGGDFQYAIMEGTDEEALRTGPGRYVDTQMPGENGNFAIAGHRSGYGEPFDDIDRLQVCDELIVETATSLETYKVLPYGVSAAERASQASSCFTPEQTEAIVHGTYAHVAGQHITNPYDVGVLSPVPGQPSNAADQTEGLITLTACHPRYSNAERIIVHGMLVDSTPKSGAPTTS
ncbi:class E sortase [Corynebacterium sp. S7]